jgi:predicted nucleic acid-binding protein
MGLITGILTLPLAPVRGVAWVAEKIAEQAELELYDENRILRELSELETAHDRGEVDEERFEAAVNQLLERLQVGQALREGRYR